MSETVVNKKASHEYFFKEKFVAGISLTGGEVKSAKAGSASLVEAYVKIINGEAFLINAYIAPYKFALDPSYDPKRTRKLLLHREEIEKLASKLSSQGLTNSDLQNRRSGLTIVPVKMYNSANLIKLEIALAVAKKKTDKRDELKKKALQRETESFLRAEKLKSQ